MEEILMNETLHRIIIVIFVILLCAFMWAYYSGDD